MNIISSAKSDGKGVLVQHQCPRPSRILKDVNGKERPDLGKYTRSQIPFKIHFRSQEKVCSVCNI